MTRFATQLLWTLVLTGFVLLSQMTGSVASPLLYQCGNQNVTQCPLSHIVNSAIFFNHAEISFSSSSIPENSLAAEHIFVVPFESLTPIPEFEVVGFDIVVDDTLRGTPGNPFASTDTFHEGGGIFVVNIGAEANSSIASVTGQFTLGAFGPVNSKVILAKGDLIHLTCRAGSPQIENDCDRGTLSATTLIPATDFLSLPESLSVVKGPGFSDQVFEVISFGNRFLIFTPVPEPNSLILLTAGLLGFGILRIRRSKS